MFLLQTEVFFLFIKALSKQHICCRFIDIRLLEYHDIVVSSSDKFLLGVGVQSWWQLQRLRSRLPAFTFEEIVLATVGLQMERFQSTCTKRMRSFKNIVGVYIRQSKLVENITLRTKIKFINISNKFDGEELVIGLISDLIKTHRIQQNRDICCWLHVV